MKNIITLVSIFVLTGCGSSATTISPDPYSSAGAATGGSIGEGGVDVVSTGGNISETGGVGGNGPTTGGAETGGETTGGVGGTCIPKTCLTIAVELANGVTDPVPDACGIVDDGCGNLIDCGGCEIGFCGSGDFQDWEDGKPEEYLSGTPNLCGGGCDKSRYSWVSCPDTSILVACSQKTSIVPTVLLSDRYDATNCSVITELMDELWCCEQVDLI
jgi:hypothetical protein